MRKKITKNSLLTDYVRANLKDTNALRAMKPGTRAKFLYDHRQKMKDAIEYLTFMFEHLPEKQLTKILDKNVMRSFLKALLVTTTENRKRILSLWRIILMDVAHTTYVAGLVGRERWQLFTHRRPSEIEALEATVYLET